MQPNNPLTDLNIRSMLVCLADLTSLYNSTCPIVENEWNCSSGDLQFDVILQLAAAWLQFDL